VLFALGFLLVFLGQFPLLSTSSVAPRANGTTTAGAG
jgi:hypothetical protein